MGGPGSGNRWRWSTRAICEHNKRIDIRYLRKKGMLRPGSSSSLSWTWGDEDSGSISCKAHSQFLELIYKYRDGNKEWQSVDEHIWFFPKEQPFGGERKYFICPSCKRRCMVLYGGAYFRCRKCYGLAYASQNEDLLDRMRRKAEKFRKRLGGELDFEWPFPQKPKGMHWRTYNRLRKQGEDLEWQHEALLAYRIERLVGFH